MRGCELRHRFGDPLHHGGCIVDGREGGARSDWADVESRPKTKPSVSLGIHGACPRPRLILPANAVAESVLFALSERELEGSSFRTGGLGLIQVLDPCTKCECCLSSGFRAAERGNFSFLVARGRRCGLWQIHECNLALPKCLLQLAV